MTNQEAEFRELAQSSRNLLVELLKAYWPILVLVLGTGFMMLASILLMVKLLFFR